MQYVDRIRGEDNTSAFLEREWYLERQPGRVDVCVKMNGVVCRVAAVDILDGQLCRIVDLSQNIGLSVDGMGRIEIGSDVVRERF